MSRMQTGMVFSQGGGFSCFFEAVGTCPECRLECFCQSCFFEAVTTCPECRLEWFCQSGFCCLSCFFEAVWNMSRMQTEMFLSVRVLLFVMFL